MNELHFTIKINAPKEKVWKVLWEDRTLRLWAGIVDQGTYMLGELEEGKTVQFNSEEGYGVTSLVEKLNPNEYVLLKHKADTKDYGSDEREDQWTGGNESYTLKETDSTTTLVLECDVPEELIDIMNTSYPKVLNKIKELSEFNTTF
jgi:uncharacterized protein YndB with AHSA1/START domain